MKLYEITEAYQQLNALQEATQEDFTDALNVLQDEFEVKADNIANLIESNKSDIDFYKNKIQELREAKTVLENKNKWLKEYLTNQFDGLDIKKLRTANHILSLRNNRASTIVENESDLPDKYKEQIETIKIDKTAIYKDLKAGIEIPGAYLKANRGITIK